MMSKKLYINITPYFRVHILFLPLIAASFISNYHIMFLTAYICAMLHEFGHIISSYLLGIKVSHIEVLPFGVCAKLKSEIIKNPSYEIAIAASGPLVNIILSIIAYFFRNSIPINDFIYWEQLNLSLAAINLIPALPLDGGRIMRAFLTKKIGSVRAYNISVKLSCIPISLLLGISIYSLLTNCFNFSLILISSFLLGNLCLEQRNISKNVLSEMLNYNSKLEKNSLTRSYVITAHKSTPARLILRSLSYDRYYIICVVDDKLQITKTLTEGEVISALTVKGIRTTLGEI